MTGWTHRVRRPPGPQELQQLRDAVQDIAQSAQAGHAPGRVRVVFQAVGDVALIGTAVIGGALAGVHLWKALFPRHKDTRQGPELAGDARPPPRRRDPRATAAADDRGGYEHDRTRSR